jgi:hypothetical protein
LRTLGHHGVLFLDEFTEFRRDAVEGPRQLEDRGLFVMRMVGSLHELDAEPSAENSAILQSLMSVGISQKRLEFLGG